jgi:hypothetical protein
VFTRPPIQTWREFWVSFPQTELVADRTCCRRSIFGVGLAYHPLNLLSWKPLTTPEKIPFLGNRWRWRRKYAITDFESFHMLGYRSMDSAGIAHLLGKYAGFAKASVDLVPSVGYSLLGTQASTDCSRLSATRRSSWPLPKLAGLLQRHGCQTQTPSHR